MSDLEIQQLQEKIDNGVRLAHKRLIEKTSREDGNLVVVQDGEVVHITGEELCEMQIKS